MVPTNNFQALIFNLISTICYPFHCPTFLLIFSFTTFLITFSTWYYTTRNQMIIMASRNQNHKTLVNLLSENPRSSSKKVQHISRKRTSISDLWSTGLRKARISVPESTIDWSKLPEDLLRLLVDRLVVEEDFIVFRSVCKSWRSAIPKSYWKRVPWLLAKKYESSKVVLKGLNSLSQNTNSLSSLFQTELSWRYWGSFTGWILGQNQLDYRLQLINPLTNVVIDLPRLGHPISKGMVYYSPGSDSLHPAIEIMAISHRYSGIAMLNDELQQWTYLVDKQHKSDFVDLVWYKDHIIAIRTNGTIVVFDEAGVAASLTPPHDKVGDHNALYLIESSGDLIILVQRHVILYGRHFEVYKLNLETGGWIEVTGLGRHSLFVGESYSISRRINDDTGDTWKPSCIYYTTYNPISEKKLYCYNIVLKRLEFHHLGHVTDVNKCYDFVWYMPAVGTK